LKLLELLHDNILPILLAIALILLFAKLYFKSKHSKVLCHVCEKPLYFFNTKEFVTNVFCREHYNYISNHEWEIVKTVDSSSESPEHLVKLWNVHLYLFKRFKTITYITHEYIEKNGNIYTRSNFWAKKRGA